MKKLYKICFSLLGFILFTTLVYATVTTARDNKSTILPWQGTPNGYLSSAHNVGLTYNEETRFTDNLNGTISDSVTGLMWQSDGVTQGTMNWDSALIYCDTLSLGGFDDWRLTNIKELNSILDYSKTIKINATYFSAVSNYYWSSTTSYSSQTQAMIVHFSQGITLRNTKTSSYNVFCVR